MNGHLLWKCYLEDDLETFKQLLDRASAGSRPSAHRSNATAAGALFAGSPANLSLSPTAFVKRRLDPGSPLSLPLASLSEHIALTRADINYRDGKGRTILHHAASATDDENANAFAQALIWHPLIDLYTQDLENGWTALHRAFYFGNITIARAILERDAINVVEQGLGSSAQTPSLIKIKDREGNGPYDVLAATIDDQTLIHQARISSLRQTPQSRYDHEEEGVVVNDDDEEEGVALRSDRRVEPRTNVRGDELFTFGSNKNINLGFGDEDDRQYPERVVLHRPKHLFKRMYREYLQNLIDIHAASNPFQIDRLRAILKRVEHAPSVPSFIAATPISIQDIQMSKYHTAVLTSDPEANLHICGHGLGGRLGTGNEKTQFNFTCVQDSTLSRKKVVAIALGQDHTLAVTEDGAIFSWGNNILGQLGIGLPKGQPKNEQCIQLVPKQIFGILKREVIVGAAASRIHSVTHTTWSLFTFGKNEGQLGIVDARAGQLSIVDTPRKIAASRFSSAIHSVSAIDRATVCLLENHEVHVFANYGVVKLQFPLDGFTNYFLKKSFLTTRYDDTPNCISKIACGGDTICALTTAGEVFAVVVDQLLDPSSYTTASTTNPNKIRAALSTPARIWSLKKSHMSARDLDVDQGGSIVLVTEAGTVWRRVARTKISGTVANRNEDKKSKEHKFSRIPGLTRITAVRASGSGAYAAVRQDCNIIQSGISIDGKTLVLALFDLLSFRGLATDPRLGTIESGQQLSEESYLITRLASAIAASEDLEKDIGRIVSYDCQDQQTTCDAYVCTTSSDVRIPVHSFVFMARSHVLREAFSEGQLGQEWSNDTAVLKAHEGEKPLLVFQGIDFLTLVELVLFSYTDQFVGFWQRTREQPSLAYRYRQVRTELMKVASSLGLRSLESAARRMVGHADPTVDVDFDLAVLDPRFSSTADAIIQLSDGELPAHSALLSKRCPFFESMFEGRAKGLWLSQRWESVSDAVTIDMRHVELSVFRLVLRHLYADVGEELFDEISSSNDDEFLDLVMDVLSVANELVLDRLSQICQSVLARHTTVRNVCQFLNAVAPCSVTEFKRLGLKYLCLSLETVLSSRLLDELDEYLLSELDEVVRENQLATQPIGRSRAIEKGLLERHPELLSSIARDRQAKIDAITVQAKFMGQNIPSGASFDDTREEYATPARRKARLSSSATSLPQTPQSKSKISSKDATYSRNSENEMALGTKQQRDRFQEAPRDAEISEASHEVVLASSLSSPVTMTTSSIPAMSLDAVHGQERQPGPWATSPLQTAKLGFREIMEQASSRKSNITLGFSSHAKSESSTPPHRERGKQHRQKINLFGPDGGESNAATPTQSPWQIPSSSPKISTEIASKHQTTIDKPGSQGTRQPIAPPLTMRQTVANVPTHAKSRIENVELSRTPQKRSVSSPQTSHAFQGGGSPSLTALGTSSPKSQSIPIQSIRHHPRPAAEISPSFYLNQTMADILSEQQAEKDVIRDAVAKRSLQEIQAEQEFQEWWDQESRKVIEEQRQQASKESTKNRGSSTSGKGRHVRGQQHTIRGRPRKNKEKESSKS